MSLNVRKERRTKNMKKEPRPTTKKVKKEAESQSASRIASRARPLTNVINNLNATQKEAVREIGFGSLLDLKLTTTPLAFYQGLLAILDDETGEMNITEDKSFVLSEDDVKDVLGLPSGPFAVEYLAMGPTAPKSVEKEKWRMKFGVKKGISVVMVQQKLLECKESGDFFKQMFVLYCMSIFLAPTSNSEIDRRLLKAVDDASEIRNKNWCSHVLSEVKLAARKPLASYLRGCGLFLVMAWFSKFDYGGNDISMELPYIKHWDDAKVLEMVKKEMEPRKFGAATLKKVGLQVSQDNAQPLPKPMKRFMKIELPDDIMTDEEIETQAADEVHALCLKNNRDFVLYYRKYSERVELMKSIVSQQQVVASNQEPSSSSGAPQLSPTQTFLKNAKFIKYLEFLDEKANSFKMAAEALSNFDEYCHAHGIDCGDAEPENHEPDPMEESVHIEDLEEPVHLEDLEERAYFDDNTTLTELKRKRKRKRKRDSRVKPPKVCRQHNLGKCKKGNECGFLHSFHFYAITSQQSQQQRARESRDLVNIGQRNHLKSKRKLLVLDVNGLLVDIVADFCSAREPDKVISGKRVYKRPFCDDFLTFCFDKFDVGIWSSRTKRNLSEVLDYLMKNDKDKFLFCWDQSHCTNTGVKTAENKDKPLFLKELKKLWDNSNSENKLPWEKGFYDETNTILLDDSPEKASRNPPHTGVFPFPYSFKNDADKSLGKDGDLRLYLERLVDAENVKSFIEENLFGQNPITQ